MRGGDNRPELERRESWPAQEGGEREKELCAKAQEEPEQL